ncbi:hypothetical protein K437DRAFT_257910 [Tilletiaria anomala UBC 951]|uniref:Sacsin/Nov domain-containing protein n=1 Tax=Tilletiaria anomala (strain ATCC 24038 / CBS 436.72 / UBC 951) TaxID=1037660 RepID=A0A066VV57_TILAU|nr:uncharacterized protein K437DRAFT_257910 [Tilletiaria anomala UBC 951]KDN42420.1 hypothetical protein K437DRAFT_257910 [Tilletiaria anomala UBC 951]
MSRAALNAAALLAPPKSDPAAVARQANSAGDASSSPSSAAGAEANAIPQGDEVIEEAITVNQRALIDKILARYAAEFTVFRELLQNADDAGAECCQLRFDTRADLGLTEDLERSSTGVNRKQPDFKAPLHHWTFKNDGKVFGADDWSRLRRIAEGNPDPDRIGAFGVGFYSLFSICEEPIVSSGDSLMGFFWKGDALYTRRAKNPAFRSRTAPQSHGQWQRHEQGQDAADSPLPDDQADSDTNPFNGLPWTTFHMRLREPAPLPDTPMALCRFLATSLTFTARVRHVELYWNDALLLRIRKALAPPQPMRMPPHLSAVSAERTMRVDTLGAACVNMHARVARAVLADDEERRSAKASRLASLASKLTGAGPGGAAAAAAMASTSAAAAAGFLGSALGGRSGSSGGSSISGFLKSAFGSGNGSGSGAVAQGTKSSSSSSQKPSAAKVPSAPTSDKQKLLPNGNGEVAAAAVHNEGRAASSASASEKAHTSPFDLVESSVHLRIATATVIVSVDRAFEREIERSTKKPPPKRTQLSLIFTGKDEYDASFQDTPDGKVDGAGGGLNKQASGVRQIFDGLMPRLNELGNVFIGFRTHQTTSFSGHIAARFIPTVERESMDFVDRYCAKWNLELLSIGGYVARAVYEAELADIAQLWTEGIGTDTSPADGKDDKSAEWLLARALHIMRFFTFRPSSPSSRVQKTLEACFFSCARQSTITLMSTVGPKHSAAVRYPNAVLAQFVKDLPTLPFEHVEQAAGFVAQVRSRALVQDIMMDDVFTELTQRALAPLEMVACLQWWISVAAHPSYDAGLRARLVQSAMCRIPPSNDAAGMTETIQPLINVRYWLNPARIPSDVPLPQTCLAYAVTSNLSTNELLHVFGWQELPVDIWVQHIISISSHSGAGGSAPDTDVCTNASFCEKFFSILARAWGSVSAERQKIIADMLSRVACVPTKQGIKLPSDAYFANVSLFEDLPIVAFPAATVKGNLEKLLTALQVRKHVELQMIFDRLISAGNWSHVDLLAYLATNKGSLATLEKDRLIKTAMLPKEGEVGPSGKDGKPKIVRYCASQLYEPTLAHKALGLPLLDWPGKPWRSGSDEAKFVFELGLQRHPPLDELLKLAADESDQPRREKALEYLFERFDSVYRNIYSLKVASVFSFVPCTVTDTLTLKTSPHLCTPINAYTNEGAAILGFPVVKQDLPPAWSEKLQLRRDPPAALLMAKLVNQPTKEPDLARKIFEYLSTCTEFTLSDFSVLGQAEFIPVKQRIRGAEEHEVILAAPTSCYFGGESETPQFKDIFLYCDYGTKAGAFLRNCGVSKEPSIEEVAQKLVADPQRFYTILGGPDAYKTILRQIASNWNRIRSPLRSQMKRSPFLLGAKAMPASTTKSTSLIDIDEDDDADVDTGTLVYDLKRPDEIVIDDDATSRMLFASSLYFAPHEDLLEENLYGQLGSPRLSRLIEERFATAGRVMTGTNLATEVKTLVLERTPLFLFEQKSIGRSEIRHDSEWLKKFLDVVEVDGEGLRHTRTLRFGQLQEQNVQRASAMTALNNDRLVLHIASNTEIDWFEVAFSLTRHLVARQHLQEVLLYMTLLSTSLRNLKRRGFHVDKILQQRKADREAEEGKMREAKQHEELARLAEPTEKDYRKWTGELTSMFPDAEPAHLDAILRAQKDSHLQNATNTLLNTPYPRKPEGMMPGPQATAHERDSDHQGFLSSWRSRFMQSRKPNEPYSSLAAGTSSIERSGSVPGGWGSEGSLNAVAAAGRSQGVTCPPRLPAQSDVVTPMANIKNNVIKAVQASRPDASESIQSEAQVQEVREASSSYCDVTGVATDLRLAGEIEGMRFFLSPDLEPAQMLSENGEALQRLINTVYKPIGRIFRLDPRALNVFADTSGPNIAFNRGGTIFLNFRYYKEWHDDLVKEGKLSEPLISTYFSVAHEIAHNVVSAHNAEHEFYFSSISETFLTALMEYMASVAAQ